MNELLSLDIRQLSKMIKSKEVSPVELVEILLDYVNKVDPQLNSFISLDQEQIIRDAYEKEREIKEGEYIGPLHGVPIGIKDNINTKDFKTTMASDIFKDYYPEEDAFVIRQLKAAGAIIFGKLNLHQFAYGPTGDRSNVGPVCNPLDISKMTGGSSSGSAAAVGANLCFGALGTDTSGSVRIPASFCGVVGMKPTQGVISNSGVFPLAKTLDHVGPLTRTIWDNAIMMNVISGHDTTDKLSVAHDVKDFTKLIGKPILNKKIGIPQNFYNEGIDESIQKVYRTAIQTLEKNGVELIDIELPNMDRILESQRMILKTEAYSIHEKNLENYPDKWDDEVKERLLTGAESKGFEYITAIQDKELSTKIFNEAMTYCDVIITLTMSIEPPDINERNVPINKSDDSHIRTVITKFTGPTNLNGLPSLTVPFGYSKSGMPVGIQLIGRAFDEAILYQIGSVLEKESYKLNKSLDR